MGNIKYNTEKIKLAEVRYFEVDRNAVEVLSTPAYVLLWAGDDGRYYNIFNISSSNFPVYKRVPYSNTTLDGDDYGTKIQLDYGEVKDGLCYILENKPVSYLFGKKEISYNELVGYVMKSDLFFVDRISLFKENIKLENLKYLKKVMEDINKLKELNEVFSSHEKGVVYCKR